MSCDHTKFYSLLWILHKQLSQHVSQNPRCCPLINIRHKLVLPVLLRQSSRVSSLVNYQYTNIGILQTMHDLLWTVPCHTYTGTWWYQCSRDQLYHHTALTRVPQEPYTMVTHTQYKPSFHCLALEQTQNQLQQYNNPINLFERWNNLFYITFTSWR